MNRLGSVVAITDETGQVVWEGEYFAYGSMQSETGGDNSWKFTGQEKDDASGMYNFKFRYLDTGLEHFMTKDPVLSDFSPYAYCYGNPVNYVDYSGLDGGSGDEGYVYWSRKWNSWTYSGVTVTAKAPPGWEPPENRYGMDLTLDGRNAYNGNMWEYDQRYKAGGGGDDPTNIGISAGTSGGFLFKGHYNPFKPQKEGFNSEQEVKSYLNPLWTSIDIYIGNQPSFDFIRQVEGGAGFRFLGIGINKWYDTDGLIYRNLSIHIGLGIGLPVFSSETNPNGADYNPQNKPGLINPYNR